MEEDVEVDTEVVVDEVIVGVDDADDEGSLLSRTSTL